VTTPGIGKVSMQEFHFVKKFDKASPILMQLCALGRPAAKAVLTGRKSGNGQKEYFFWTFTDVLISSFQTGASSVASTDQISFNFAKIEMEYREQKTTGELGGAIKRGFDFATGKPI
jgi:type VI secretion system secreted protein Hcp